MFRRQLHRDYIGTFWAVVYAADPNYKHFRGDGPKPMPIESAAAQAAVDELITRGILVR